MRPFERAIVDTVVFPLPDKAQRLTLDQLAILEFVERSNPRIIALHLRDWPERLKITERPFDNALFKVQIEVDGKKETANVVYYGGFISTDETKNHRKFYRRKTVGVVKVEAGNPMLSKAISNRQARTRERLTERVGAIICRVAMKLRKSLILRTYIFPLTGCYVELVNVGCVLARTNMIPSQTARASTHPTQCST